MTFLDQLACLDVDAPGVPLRLSSRLWPAGLHIGDRVIVEDSSGQTICGTVDANEADQPIVVLDAPLDCATRTVTVRLARGGR